MYIVYLQFIISDLNPPLLLSLGMYVQALRLICELCLYYHIRDPSLWANLLEQLLSLEMVTKSIAYFSCHHYH